jgi:8-oxo-dGTP pyrophosphatase MutT (NUDIX family)
MIKLAAVMLELKGTDYLVFQRRDDIAPTSPNMLGFFGGHMEPGEENDPLKAAYRELSEETSLGLGKVPLTFVAEFDIPPAADNYQDGNCRTYLFKGKVSSTDFKVYEGIRSEIYTKDEALKRSDLAHVVKYILERI